MTHQSINPLQGIIHHRPALLRKTDDASFQLFGLFLRDDRGMVVHSMTIRGTIRSAVRFAVSIKVLLSFFLSFSQL